MKKSGQKDEEITKQFVEQRRRRHNAKKWSNGSYLTLIYLLMKLMFITEILINISLLNYFIGTTDYFWGWTILSKLASGFHWQDNGYFPRVTFCDVTIRDVGQVRTHTIQCVLMMNMFIEKMYIILWIFMFFSLIVSIFNFFAWIYRIYSRRSVRCLIKNSLRSENDLISNSEADSFIKEYLEKDGILLLQLLSSNVGHLKTTDVVTTLYHRYLEKMD